jgi:hypothetical protein
LNAALKYLVAQELLVERATTGLELLEKAEPVVGVLEVAEAFTELWERQGMIALFLQNTGLSAVGLGCDQGRLSAIVNRCQSFEASAPGTPRAGFETGLVNYGVVAPLKVRAAGAWWEVAKTLRHLEEVAPLFHQREDFTGWGIDLKVYEVSHCAPSDGSCDPGWGSIVGSDTVVNPGIHPELYFDVILLYKGQFLDDYAFAVPYDAVAWTETQSAMRGVLP